MKAGKRSQIQRTQEEVSPKKHPKLNAREIVNEARIE
jgi:hypothetical protein